MRVNYSFLCLVITEFYSKIARVRRSFTLFPTEFYSFADGVAFLRVIYVPSYTLPRVLSIAFFCIIPSVKCIQVTFLTLTHSTKRILEYTSRTLFGYVYI